MKESRKRWMILITTLISTFMCTMDSSIVNVALPIMADELHTGMGGVEWVVSSYTITICASILLFGKLGDTLGKTKVFKLGIILFTIGSLFCAISVNLPLLVLSRVFQGIGASATMATNQGIIAETFPKEQRGRALGLGGTFVALGMMLGPTLGGFIVSIWPWYIIFLINVPVGIFALIAAFKTLPKKARKKEKIADGKGSVLLVFSILLFFSSITIGQTVSYESPWILGSFFGGIALGVLFFFVERREKTPVVSVSIFRNRIFSLSLFCALLSFTAMGALNIMLPFYLQETLNMSTSMAGLMMTVSPLILAFVGPMSGVLSDKIGCEIITFVGLLVSGFGFLLMSSLNQSSYLWEVALFIAVVSFGNSMFQSPNTAMIMSSVKPTELGIAGSMNAFVRNLGISLGVACSTALLYACMSNKIGYTVHDYVDGRDDVFVFGMHWVFILAGVLTLAGAACILLRMYHAKKLKNEY